jgi:hypothetical protein
MDTKKFKALIKECVREAVREELGLLLLESLKQNAQPLQESQISMTTDDVHSVGLKSNLRAKMASQFGTPNGAQIKTNLKVDANSTNPFAAFLEDTAANTPASELRQMGNLSNI